MILPGIESFAFDKKLNARVQAVLRWEAEHESLLQIAANDWTRAERTFPEVVEGMGQFLPAQHRMVEEMLADASGAQRPVAHERGTWRAESPCGCCLVGHLYVAGSKACSFAAGGFDHDPCKVGAFMWRELLARVAETPGCPDPKVWGPIVADIHGLPASEEPKSAPPDRPWLLSLLLPPEPFAAADDVSWLGAFQVTTAWLWGLHLLTAP